MQLHVDPQSPIPIRLQLAEQLKHFIARGGFRRDQALPSIREMAGFLGINPNTVARVVEDLKRSGHVEARRGKGVFVARNLPEQFSPALREAFLKEVVTRGAALGMTATDLAVGVFSLAEVRPAAVRGTAEILLVECTREALDFFAKELEAHLPVRVDKVLPRDLPAAVRRRRGTAHWAAAVTSFFHLPEVERQLRRKKVPVIAVLAGAHIETLQQLARLRPGTRVGVAAADHETAHNLEHSIVNAGLPNIALVGSCPAEGPGLDRLVNEVEVMVCSSPAADRVRRIAGSATRVIIDDRALDKRAIEMLAALLVRRDGAGPEPPRSPPGGRSARARSVEPSSRRARRVLPGRTRAASWGGM